MKNVERESNNSSNYSLEDNTYNSQRSSENINSVEVKALNTTLLANSEFGMAILGNDQHLVWCNQRFINVLFPTLSDDVDLFDCPLPDNDEIGDKSFRERLAINIKNPHATDMSYTRSDNYSVRLRLDKQTESGRLILVEEIPQCLQSASKDEISIQHDPLTGLGNRLMFQELLSTWAINDRADVTLAVILVDLDRFKHVNDSLGHDIGDQLLVLAAKRLAAATRKEDVVIRIGGDEFVILHHIKSKSDSAELVAKRIIDLVSRPYIVEGQQIHIGASVGISVLNQGTDNVNDLLKNADLALYESKKSGRGVYRFFEPALANRARERRELEIDLRRALKLKEFFLLYQPQINLKSGAVQGFEALIRWDCPKRGLVSPLDFIPLSEELGEIHAIGEWVLRTACIEALNWEADLSIAVNVSPVQLQTDRFVPMVSEVLDATGLAANRLELEITEGVLLDNSSMIKEKLWALKSLGVNIAMDDFGTGYSSLSYLNSFPFSKIKIDQSFVRGDQTPKTKALVSAILKIGDSLQMKTIAEGVETKEQYDELAAKGCRAAQGYLISKPIKQAEINKFLSAFIAK